jgi:hypothetical protein
VQLDRFSGVALMVWGCSLLVVSVVDLGGFHGAVVKLIGVLSGIVVGLSTIFLAALWVRQRGRHPR